MKHIIADFPNKATELIYHSITDDPELQDSALFIVSRFYDEAKTESELKRIVQNGIADTYEALLATSFEEVVAKSLDDLIRQVDWSFLADRLYDDVDTLK